MRLLNTAPHDEVAELLATVRVRSTVYCLSELREPWGFEVDGASVAKFHLVRRLVLAEPGRARACPASGR